MSVAREEILQALDQVTDPTSGRTVVQQDMIQGLVVKDGHVGFVLEVPPGRGPQSEPLRKICEAMVLGVKAGLDPQTIYEVVRVSTGASAAWELRVPRIRRGDFAPGGTVDISYKDQELETAFAKRLGVPLLLANLTQQVYQMARAQGLNKHDGSAIVKIFEQMAGVTVKPD